MTYIYVVTHPQASHHTDGLVGGWYDSVLTGRGLRHAQQIADDLHRRIMIDDATPQDIRLVSSDLTRAQQTAEAIAEAFKLPIRLDARLREQHHGKAEGKPVGTNPYESIPPTGNRMHFISGPGMESRAVWADRIYAAMTDIYDAAETTIVVTHGGSLTYVVASWIGMPLHAAGRVKFQTSPGSITVLHDDNFHSDHVVAELNSTAHLL